MQATDVFVIGGGPAGLAVAIAARRKGLHVTVADGARPPIDKACGEGLMPDGLAALRSLGVFVGPQEAHPFRGIRLIAPGAFVEARFPEGDALGIRRTVLHPRMIEAAAAAGVRMLWGTPVRGICVEGVQLGGGTVPARWIIGADGFQSRVRRWAGLSACRRKPQRFGFRMHYRLAPWSDFMELHWGEGCQIYVTPVSPEEVCVALISRDSHLRLDHVFAQFPELKARLQGACHTTSGRGAVTANCRLKRVWRDRVALVGDASGSVDAITGEGLCQAFHQAIALADCLDVGTLAGYQQAHRALAQRPTRIANCMLALDQRARLRGRTLRALSAKPEIFRKMLSMHVGVLPPAAFAPSGCALAWQMLVD